MWRLCGLGLVLCLLVGVGVGAADTLPPAVAASDSPMVLFVQGMNSDWGCDPGEENQQVNDLYSYVQGELPGLDLGASDFGVFSYGGLSSYCGPDKLQPDYETQDTCASIVDHAGLFRQWYEEVTADRDEVYVLSHSMGGVVVGYALTFWEPANLHAVVTLDSPLQGRPLASWGNVVPLPFDGCTGTADRYMDLDVNSGVIAAINALPADDRGLFTTIRNQQDKLVPADSAYLNGAWLDRLIDESCGDTVLGYPIEHSCVFDSPTGRQAVVDTFRFAGSVPVASDSIYWPQQRHDSARTGFNASEFTLEPPLELVWKLEGAVATSAEPIAGEGLVFASCCIDDSLAFDAADGSVAWQVEGVERPQAVRGSRVFHYGGIAGQLTALDINSGGVLWNREGVGNWPAARTLGFTETAVLNGKFGFSEGTGETLWENAGQCAWEEFAVSGGSIYAGGFGPNKLSACDTNTATVKWELEELGGVIGWPVVADGRVYFKSDEGADKGTLYSVDATSGGDVKSYEVLADFKHKTAPAVAYGRVFFGAEDGIFRALDAETLDSAWQTTLLGPITSHPSVANYAIYVTTRAGDTDRLWALDAVDGDVLWTFDFDSSEFGQVSPIVAGGQLFLVGDTGDSDDLYAFRNAVPGPEFVDIEDSVFEDDILWLAKEGITRGCNPPVNDRFCPDDVVTRGQMASFLVRALGLVEGGGDDLFRDDAGSVHELDIDRLGTAGVTRGCNPPLNDRFCPDEAVSRGQMAAFLVRALGYTDDGGGDLFVDDDDSIFETDVDKLATAGVTRGCNPPVNDQFCPTSNVTRGQMAAFLHRALGT